MAGEDLFHHIVDDQRVPVFVSKGQTMSTAAITKYLAAFEAGMKLAASEAFD